MVAQAERADKRRSSVIRGALQRLRDWRRFRLLTAAAIAILAATLAWLRLVPATRDVLWAEDGRNFLQDAITSGPFAPLLQPYSGYLHVIPRLIAGVTVALAPVSGYALWMTAGACIAAGIMAAIVYVCSSTVVPWVPARIALGLLTVLVPLAPREVLGNTANLHSLVFWTLCWVLVYRPRTRRGGAALAAFALLGAMTEIQTVLLAPLLLFHPRSRRRSLVRGAYLLGACSQLFVTLFWPRHHNTNPLVGLPSLLYGYLFNASASVWVPQKLVGTFAEHVGLGGLLVTAIPFVIAYLGILRFGTRRIRWFASAVVMLSFVVYTASIEITPRASYDYATLSPAALSASIPLRYGVVPSLLLCALIPLVCACLVGRIRSRSIALPKLARTGVALAALVLCFAVTAQFVPPNRREGGPQWMPEVKGAATRCETLPDSHAISLAETIGWHVDIPCRMIER
jgi:hypothetical protein